MHSNAEIIEQALKKHITERLPCFPLIDIAFASAYSGHQMRDVQLDPRLHAMALSKCASELPVDGVYINLCLDTIYFWLHRVFARSDNRACYGGSSI